MKKLFLLAVCLLLVVEKRICAEDWKLQELAYNNPELIVDLGVGLWAWPMPMDYDGDGDLDLLVSCPDKPSNGTYFFENPGTREGGKLPIFKPAVRVGKGSHNLQVSFVDEKPRVLLENIEFVGFEQNGFSKPKTIYPNSKLPSNRSRGRMWRYADWEGDGDQDLIVGVGDWSDYEWDQAYDSKGNWRNGPLHGWVYLIENVEGEYSQEPVKIKANGSPIDVYGWPSPNLADFDGDGDLDLICGEFLDGFTYFQNSGTRSTPEFSTGIPLKGTNGEVLRMHLQMITPTAVDWDGDGDQDLIVGDEDGRVALIENVTNPGDALPQFKQPIYFQQEADTLKFGALATPFAYDWDKDGDEDILCGNTAGHIGIFTNLDGMGTRWSGPKLLKVDNEIFRIMAGNNGSIQGPAEAKWGYTTFSLADWDGDGRDDFIVNSILAELTLLKNTGMGFTQESLPFWSKEKPPGFYWNQTTAENLQTQWRTTPFATDFDQDGELDLIILDQEGYLTCQSRASTETRLFIDQDNRPIRLNARTAGRSGRYKLDVVDWDQDGRKDILVNSENAMWYRNCGVRAGKTVLKKVGNLARRNVAGHTSSPSTCDFNKDGRPDLLVGAENGRIYFIPHEDCVEFSDVQKQAREPQLPSPSRFPGLKKETFIFTNVPFPECHASTISETKRGLVAAWFGGTEEKNPDVGIWSSYNDGGGWSTPKEWADGVQHSTLRYPTWNPVLFQPPGDTPLMLFFKVGPDPRNWWGEVMVSYDAGRSFRDRRRLPESIDGPVRSKPFLLPNGNLLCPSSTEHGNDWRIHFETLSQFDHPELGESWGRVEQTEQPYQVIQPSFLHHPGGLIQALCRSKHEKIVQTFSKDQGKTWSPLEMTELPNNNSGIEALTLQDGRHLLLYNHMGGGRRSEGWGKRNILHLAISEDGQTWKAAAIVEKEDKGEFSYPAMIQTKDGLVHMTYTWNRKRVKHVVINPKELITQPISVFD